MRKNRGLLLIAILVTLFIATLALAACNLSFGGGGGAGTLSVQFDNHQVVYEDDSLEMVKSYLTVTYTNQAGVAQQVTDFTLSGTLAAGDCELTVAYKGLTAKVTINVADLHLQLEDATALAYELNDDGTYYVVIGLGEETRTEFAIPSTYNDLPVQVIGDEAFANCDSITSVIIPNSVQLIYDGAFCDCTSITNISIPNSVTSIGENAFSNCSSLISIVIPDSVTSIGNAAFEGCNNLESITIPFVGEKSEEADNSFFGYIFGSSYDADNHCYVPASLKKVTITSASVIGERAFAQCGSLTSIVIPESVTSIGKNAFIYCSSLVNITIPSNVMSIGGGAFRNCSDLAMVNWNATACTSVGDIFDTIFSGCSSLTTVNIGANVTTIPSNTFSGCNNLAEITIPGSVTSIGQRAFFDCYNLKSITFGENSQLNSIGDYAFYRCSGLKAVYITDIAAWCGVSFADSPLFYTHNLYLNGELVSNLEIPDSVTEIKDYAFYECVGLTNVVIPDSVTSIGERVFYHCYKLKSVTLGENSQLESIGYDAFMACINLTSITIPLKVTAIDSGAFSDCYKLIEVCNLSELDITAGSSDNGYVGYCAKNVYTATEGSTKLFTDSEGYIIYTDGDDKTLVGYVGTETELVLPVGITKISYAALCINNFISVVIPSGVTSIGELSFVYCNMLTKIVIPGSVTLIDDNAFYGCYKLVEVYNLSALDITAGSDDNGGVACYAKEVYSSAEESSKLSLDDNGYITYIDEDEKTLVGYTGAETELVFPSDITKIDDYAFSYCDTIVSVTIPSSVVSIGTKAFEHCSSLEHITFGENSRLESIGSEAFESCSCLTNFCVPNSVLSIGNLAFYGCDNLVYNEYDNAYYLGDNDNPYLVLVKAKSTDITSCEINEKTCFIMEYAFMGCASLSNIVLPESVISIGKGAFASSNLTSIVIPHGITSVDEYVFYGCRNLTSVVIPSSVTSIYFNSFYNCASLTEVHVADISAWCNVVFSGRSYWFDGYESPFAVAFNLYLNDELVTELKIPSTVTEIKANAFSNCSSLASVTFGENSQLESIGSCAFRDCCSLTSIEIPASVTSIGSDAFEACSSLTAVHMSDIAAWCNIEFISYNANPLYYAHNLYLNGELVTNLDIPSIVTEIKNYAFCGSSLTDVVIPSSVTSIDRYAFEGCSNLTSIVVPDSVEMIDNSAFSGCSSITSVTFGENSQLVSIGEDAFEYCSSLKNIVIPDSVTSIGEGALAYCSSLEEITVPFIGASKEENEDTHLGYLFGAWGYSSNGSYVPTSLKKVTITSATSIGSYAFYGCKNLTSIVIPNSIIGIGNYAFDGCSSLKNIYYYGNQKGWNAITKGDSWNNNTGDYKIVYNYGSVLKESVGLTYELSDDESYYIVTDLGECSDNVIVIPTTYEGLPVLEIGEFAFSGYNITRVELNDQILAIGAYAFESCRLLTSITIPASVTSIDDYAFYNCVKLVEVYNFSRLPIVIGSEENGYIGYYAKAVRNSIDEVSIIDNVGNLLFMTDNGTNYLLGGADNETELVLPDSYNGESYEIYPYAFWYHTDLMSITISCGVAKIGDYAFGGAFRLIEVYNLSSLQIEVGSDDNGMVACYAMDVYTSKDTPSKLSENSDGYIIYTDGDKKIVVNYIGAETELVLPTDITGINYGAFYGCADIVSVEIPDGVTRLPNWTFDCCYSLTSVIFGKNSQLKSIDGYAFYYCTSLTDIAIPDSVISIGWYAFYCCTSLESVALGDGVMAMGDGAFGWCTSLVSIKISSNTTSIGDYAFEFCDSLTSVVIPSGVTSIGEGAFYHCSSITSIEIPDSVTSIGDYAFEGCYSLTIYCEAESQPSGWGSYWNSWNCPVVWRYVAEE